MTGPERLDLKVGYHCNDRCLHCTVEVHKEEARRHRKRPLSTQECIETLTKGVARGVTEVVITGGEPTLRNDLPELLAFCAERGLLVHFQSNGRRFSRLSFARSIQRFENVIYIIALHGADAATHQRITQVPNSFLETVTGIQNLRTIGRSVVGKIVISRLNQHCLGAVVNLFSQLRVDHVSLAFPNISGGVARRFEQLMPRYEDLACTLEDVIAAATELGVSVEFESVPYCIIPEHPELISDVQYVRPITRSLVHLDEKPVDWNVARQNMKKKPSACGRCLFDKLCEGVWRQYLDIFGPGEFRPVDTVRPAALARFFASMARFDAREVGISCAHDSKGGL